MTLKHATVTAECQTDALVFWLMLPLQDVQTVVMIKFAALPGLRIYHKAKYHLSKHNQDKFLRARAKLVRTEAQTTRFPD